MLLKRVGVFNPIDGSPWCRNPGIEITGAIHRLQLSTSQKEHAWAQTAAISDPMPDLRWVHRIKHPGCSRVRNSASPSSEIPSSVESEVGIRSYADFIVTRIAPRTIVQAEAQRPSIIIVWPDARNFSNDRRNDRSDRPDHQQSEPPHGLCPCPPARASPRATPLTISRFLPCDAYHDKSIAAPSIEEGTVVRIRRGRRPHQQSCSTCGSAPRLFLATVIARLVSLKGWQDWCRPRWQRGFRLLLRRTDRVSRYSCWARMYNVAIVKR